MAAAVKSPRKPKSGSKRTHAAASHAKLHAAASAAVGSAAVDIDPTEDVRTLRKLLGLRQDELARMFGGSIRSVAGWEAGTAPSGPARLKVLEISRLARALAGVMPRDRVGRWLREPNKAFAGQPPLQLIERGESDRLWKMIHEIDANVAN